MATQLQNILIRGTNWVGDAVLILPAIRSIRKAFPCAHISLLVKPWVSEIFNENPYIDEIILYDSRFKGFTGRLKLAKILSQKKFDTAILFQNAFDAALLSWLSKIPERIGYKRNWRSLFLTKAIPLNKNVLKQHQIYYYLKLLETINIKTTEIQPYIYLTEQERQWARNILHSFLPDEHGPLIGINPGATYGSAKRWPSEKFAELANKIINELDGRVIIFGSPSEIEIAKEIVNEITKKAGSKRQKVRINTQKTAHSLPITHYQSRILVMSGKTSIRGLAALIAECTAFITNDSGPMHIASSLFVPVVAIFGSTNSSTTGPFGQGHKVISKNLPCAPCMKRQCPEKHLKCMTDISAEEVFDILKEILPQKKAVFLDRDGTIIEDKNYLNSFEELVIFPETKENLQRLKEAGFKIIGITNQSGIAREIVDKDFVIKSNIYLRDKLGIDDFYYCPHHPDEHCYCRKPEPMLTLMAKVKHMINLKTSYVVGDKESDMLLAKKVGAAGILLTAQPPESTSASYAAKDLSNAVEWILERERKS